LPNFPEKQLPKTRIPAPTNSEIRPVKLLRQQTLFGIKKKYLSAEFLFLF